MYEYFAYIYVYVPCVCLVPAAVTRRGQIPWNWSHEGLDSQDHMNPTWMLGTELGTSARATNALGH